MTFTLLHVLYRLPLRPSESNVHLLNYPVFLGGGGVQPMAGGRKTIFRTWRKKSKSGSDCHSDRPPIFQYYHGLMLNEVSEVSEFSVFKVLKITPLN